MNDGPSLKNQLLAHCRDHVATRMASIESALRSIEIARNNESKSSAGDKFETGRAMMQMEEAKLNHQLAEVGELRRTLDRIERQAVTESYIGPGSLVATNRGLYYLALGIGKVKLTGRTVFCTSLEAPIGKALIGKQVGEIFTYNELEFIVRGVA